VRRPFTNYEAGAKWNKRWKKAIAALVELLRENRQKKSTWLWEAVHSTTTTNGRSSRSSNNRIACTYIHSHTSSCCCNSTCALGCNWVHEIARRSHESFFFCTNEDQPSLSLSPCLLRTQVGGW
jgi:hypothetical protein